MGERNLVSGFKNTYSVMKDHAHGFHNKDLIVLHETVSGDIPGWKDIDSIESYLASKDYGIHGMTDAEGNIAWAYGLGKAIFWQAGGVNERSVGIEQVSNIMLRSPSNAVRRKLWVARNKQLRATAKLVAAISYTHKIPLVASDGTKPGVTSHWDVSQHFAASDGHTDCWPVNKKGYFPLNEVIWLARAYKAAGSRL
jgi:hypothetical protein